MESESWQSMRTLTVRLEPKLKMRVRAAAALEGVTLSEFVGAVLEEATKDHRKIQNDVRFEWARRLRKDREVERLQRLYDAGEAAPAKEKQT